MYDVSLKRKWDAFSIRETQELDLADAIENGLKQGIAKGIEQGLEQGLEQGEHRKAIAIAVEFKKMGFSYADISKGTGLSIAEIEAL